MKKQVRGISIFLIVFLVISVSVNVVLALDNVQSEPGSDQDPLVSKSYVDTNTAKNDAVIKQLQNEIEVLKGKLAEGGGGSEGLKAVELEPGTAILAGSGSEIILRMGKAVAVKGDSGCLTDITSAKDLTSGVAASINHLLISSRDDGRGLKAVTKTFLLVRGAYKTEISAAGNDTEPPKDDTKPDAGTKPDADSKPGNDAVVVKTAVIKATSLNIRTSPDIKSKLAGSALKGEKVTVVEKKGEWTRIKKANGIEGWVQSKYLQ